MNSHQKGSFMKKLLALLAALTLCVTPLAALAETVVTSFYPIYLFARSLTEGVEGVTLRNLAAQGTGCLHDYQLQTGDMKALAAADVFLINGAGMERYLSHVTGAFPALPVVDASVGVTLLGEDDLPVCVSGEEHDHDHAVNAHVWLDVRNAIIMQGCKIKSGAVVEYAIVDRNNIVPEGTELKGTTDNILIKEKTQK